MSVFSSPYLVWIVGVVLAVALDILLLRRLGHYLRQRGLGAKQRREEVHIYGEFSPLLTWLKYRKLPAGTPPQTEPLPMARPANFQTRSLIEALRRWLSPWLDRFRAWMDQPLPPLPFSFPPPVSAPAVLLLGGGLLALLNYPFVEALPEAVRWLAWTLSVMGALVAGLGVYAVQSNRAIEHVLPGLRSVCEWLKISSGQIACLGLSGLFALTAGMHAYLEWSRLINPPVAVFAWGLGVILAVIGAGSVQADSAPRPRRSVIVWVMIFVACGFALRAFDLEHIPVNLSGDEGSSGLNAVYFVNGEVNNLFGIGWHGFPALYFYLQSLPIPFLGQTATAIRISSAFAGALTVGALYLLGRAMFGHRAGVLAAILLAALHYHLHFSRIALNNVWDGLTYVVTLGALWYGWHTERRSAYLLAGLGLGFAQYFYPSARSLLGLVPLWLILVGLLDQARFKRALPSLALMALIAVIVVLPLAWFYVVHPDEFWGAITAQSALPALTAEAGQTGAPVVLLMLQKIGLGLLAFAASPLQFWYRPETPILRTFPALFFVIGLVTLVIRWRDTRTAMLGLWLLAFGVIGGMSESTPAAQRYVASAPVCALLAGYGLSLAVDFLPKIWPRLAALAGRLAIIVALLMAADDARFYFLDYTPQSYFGGRYDFEGEGGAVARLLADDLRRQSNEWQVLFFGAPRMGYYSIPSLQYLAPGKVGLDMNYPWGSPENPQPSSDHLISVFLWDHTDDLAAAQASYPGGLLIPAYGNLGQLVYYLYQYPSPPPALGDSQLTVDSGLLLRNLFGLIALAALAVAFIWLWRRLQKNSISTRLQPVTANAPLEIAPSILVEAARPAERPSAPAIAARSEPAPAPTLASQPAPTLALPQEPALEPAPLTSTEAASPPSGRPVAIPAKPLEPTASADANSASTVSVTPTTNGTARVTLEVPIGAVVRVTVETWPASHGEPGQATVNIQPSPHPAAGFAPGLPSAPAVSSRVVQSLVAVWDRIRARLAPLRLDLVLFGLSLGIYLLTRFVGLDRFPIYFFTDEAVHMNLAADFIRDGFKNYERELWPTYFSLGPSFGLNGASVYLQVVPYLLFGKSIFVTRAVSALVTFLGAMFVGLIVRDVFQKRYGWTATLLLAIAPAWFLHSRTAFEYIELASFFAGFLYFYLRYRYHAPRNLYAAIGFGALVFYTHGLGQLLIAVTAVLLFLSDLPYHWQNRATLARGFLLLIILALPYLRYASAHAGTFTAQLRQRDSYWVLPHLTLWDKVWQFGAEYFYGLSPQFWFFPNDRDLVRHVMKGYGNLWWPTLPFAGLGLLIALRNIRSSAHRTIVLALLATPVSSALVAIGVTRMLWFIIPATVLTALGLCAALEWLERRRVSARLLALSVFVGLSGSSVYMLYDALTNGPVWFTDYTLYGMQYGAKQLFQETIPGYLARDPQTHVLVSPNWANGTDQFINFFVPPEQFGRVAMRNVEYYMYDRRDLAWTDVLVMTPDEYGKARTDPKFKAIRVEQVLDYPDGNPGFYFARVAYADNADEIFANERAERLKPVEGITEVDGQTVAVTHSRFGGGELVHLFDDDPYTLIRGEVANPLAFDFRFPTARPVTGLTLTTGTMGDYTVTVRLYAPAPRSEQPVTFEQRFQNQPDDPTIHMAFDGGPAEVARLELLITDNLSGETGQTHVREITLEQ